MKAFKTSMVVGARAAEQSAGHVRPSVEQIYAAHAEFVWKTLHRMGVREADLPDMLQETFVVVHRRLGSFDGSSRLTTWLYGICARVAAGYRRKAHVRRERPVETLPEGGASQQNEAESTLAARDARMMLDEILASMDIHKRAVFVMFEIEEMSCAEIAAMLEVPVGTIHSRLHGARKTFRKGVVRLRARQEKRGEP